jgi:acetoin utilization deacetylase AcuC-like enzyme
LNVYYSPAYVGSGYAFETTRKSKWVADALDDAPISNIRLLAPEPLSREQVTSVHDPRYVSAVQTGSPLELAQSQGFIWDAGLWAMVLASNGGAVVAALDALRSGLAGSLSSGLHHARHGAGLGYCTFNGLVIAAREALAAGAKSVLILDLDAHCGGGTASMIGDEPRIWQLDISVDGYDRYESSDRIQLQMVQCCDTYLSQIENSLREIALRGPRFDLCLYNAGMDPFEGCSDGGLVGITKEMLAAREQLVFEWCRQQGLPVAFSLAGCYIGQRLDRQGLVNLHRLTLTAAAQSDLMRHAR